MVYSNVQQRFQEVMPTISANRSNLFGQTVRLAFHDAGEFDQNTDDNFGPDGCIDLVNGDSAGIVEKSSLVYSVLEPIWQENCDLILRADFWVLFAKFVLEEASGGNMSIPFQYGRKDAVGGCSLTKGRLPDATGGSLGAVGEIHRVFLEAMGLTMDDAVTLIGARTVGHVHPEHSSNRSRVTSSTPGIAHQMSLITTTTSTRFVLVGRMCTRRSTTRHSGARVH